MVPYDAGRATAAGKRHYCARQRRLGVCDRGDRGLHALAGARRMRAHAHCAKVKTSSRSSRPMLRATSNSTIYRCKDCRKRSRHGRIMRGAGPRAQREAILATLQPAFEGAADIERHAAAFLLPRPIFSPKCWPAWSDHATNSGNSPICLNVKRRFTPLIVDLAQRGRA